LAEEIVRTNNRSAVKELVENVGNKNRDIQSDCIKVLYEIGERKPGLIVGFAEEFASLLESLNPRLTWGAMTALDTIAAEDPGKVFDLLPKILAGAESGSVIARDHAVGILVKLGSIERYAPHCFPLLLKQLKRCPNNQLPMYAEMSAKIVNDRNKEAFNRVVETRGRSLEKESQRKRLAKVLKKVMA
jgi:hypothetical protein